MVASDQHAETARVRELLSKVTDPEIPVLTLEDLGVLRDIAVDDGKVTVTITPTYAGCPAMQAMKTDIETTLATAGYGQVTVRQTLSPAWSTDWMSEDGVRKLRAYGIAPPMNPGGVECPQCHSSKVKRISEFGSTACKALYRCEDCLEPFDYFKCI